MLNVGGCVVRVHMCDKCVPVQCIYPQKKLCKQKSKQATKINKMGEKERLIVIQKFEQGESPENCRRKGSG